jgi:hypothetical protein
MKSARIYSALVILLGCVHCNRAKLEPGNQTSTAATTSAMPVLEAGLEPGGADGSAPTEGVVDAGLSEADINKALESAFGERARHTTEELKVIAYVERHLNGGKAESNRSWKYLVDRVNGIWVVNAIPTEILMNNGRDGGVELHVQQTKSGYRILKGIGR